MPWLESAAVTFLVPAGCQRDPAAQPGLAKLTAEMLQRGCGDLPSRELEQAMDQLGLARSTAVTNYHTRLSAAMPATHLSAALTIYASLLQRPLLPAAQIDDGRMVCIQELLAMQDDLSQKLMEQLRIRQYPDPYSRSSHGTLETLQDISIDDVQQFYTQHFTPHETIISIAGNVDSKQVFETVNELFGKWIGDEAAQITTTPPPNGHHHIKQESNQTQIGIVFPSVPYSHPDYFQSRGAIGVLSDGMSSRLFSEVREKRGLCYTVFAMCHTLREQGCVLTYAGTTTERAQETLDVLLAELVRLGDGILPAELDRLKAKIKSGLIMQQESSNSRASSIAADWHLLGKVRTTGELSRILDDLSCDSINHYLTDNRPANFRIVTLGQDTLNTSAAATPDNTTANSEVL
ncbi:MAG: insulinase family protein [Planctomycetaceae bacterium]|nr:insulinase family protein [Planctomycetaceae bacterium]